MRTIVGYENNVLNSKLLDINEFKDNIKNYEIESICLDYTFIIQDNKYVYYSKDNPICYIDEAFVCEKTISISSEYFEGIENELNDLVVFICKNIKTNTICINDISLISNEVIDALASNDNITEITFGTRREIYYLNKDVYLKLKNANKKKIITYGISKNLEDNFDPLIEFNSKKQLVSYYTYADLSQALTNISITKRLSESEIVNLKYLNKNVGITFNYNDYINIFSAISVLRNNGNDSNVEIRVKDKNLFNNYVFKYLSDKEIVNIKVLLESNLEEYDLKTYMTYEKKLFEMVKPALNLSPFEKYLYVYNKVKKFKEYKENEQNKSEARDLYNILDNEYMVCVGYSKLLGDLLLKLGIESDYFSINVDTTFDNLDDDILVIPDYVFDKEKNEMMEIAVRNGKHVRRIVNIVDPKYDIEGYYFADPTWDNVMDKDYYLYALMTGDEFVGNSRYTYVNNNNINELLFIHSLEEFYEKINYYLIKNPRKNEKDVILLLCELFKKIDIEFYNYLKEKYYRYFEYSKQINYDMTQDIFLEIGEYLLNKLNNLVDGNKFREGIKEIYITCYGVDALELDEIVDKVIEDNKNLYEIEYPKRFRIDNNSSEMLLINVINKFDINGDIKLGI